MSLTRPGPTRHRALPGMPPRSPGGAAAFVLSLVVAALALLGSVVGLLAEGVYTGPASTAEMLRAWDLVTAVVVVPVLAGALVVARRGSPRAELTWASMLACLAYTYAYYVFGTGFNDLFLLHVATLSTSAIALILVLSGLRIDALADDLGPDPGPGGSLILGLLAVGLAVMGSSQPWTTPPRAPYPRAAPSWRRTRWSASALRSTSRAGAVVRRGVRPAVASPALGARWAGWRCWPASCTSSATRWPCRSRWRQTSPVRWGRPVRTGDRGAVRRRRRAPAPTSSP